MPISIPLGPESLIHSFNRECVCVCVRLRPRLMGLTLRNAIMGHTLRDRAHRWALMRVRTFEPSNIGMARHYLVVPAVSSLTKWDVREMEKCCSLTGGWTWTVMVVKLEWFASWCEFSPLDSKLFELYELKSAWVDLVVASVLSDPLTSC